MHPERSQFFSSADELDAADPLRSFRERFYIPQRPDGSEVVYFTGNSLGLQPKTTRAYVDQELEDWAKLGVEGHLHARHPWLPYHEFLTEQMARVVGAKPIETVVMNSLTVNLHLMMVTFYRPTSERYKIVIEKGAFPSDQYAVKSQIEFHDRLRSSPPYEGGVAAALGGRGGSLAASEEPLTGGTHNALIELTPREGETTLRTEDIIDTIEREGDSIALVLLGGVNYYTGQVFDMQAITEAAHRVGAVAGAFVHERHTNSFDLPRFAGWWGHDKQTRFLMGPDFVPIPGAEGWQISNPPILQMATLRASLEIFDEAGMPALRIKSETLTGYLEHLLDQIQDDRISVITSKDPSQRGCQLSIRVENADTSLFESIISNGVAADWREPDVIRVAPVPLYNSFTDVNNFVRILRSCLK
jgi:kynureninase